MASTARQFDRAPLGPDGPDDVIRVGGTRVTLDVVIEAFRDGATPEEIVQQYPSLALGEVYAVIGYYLHHRSEIDAYLQARNSVRQDVRREVEARFDPAGLRARLLARRTA